MSVAVRILPGESEHESLSPVTSRVIETCMDVRQSRRSFSELHDAIMELEKFIFSSANSEGAEAILSGITPEVVARLNDAYSFWENRLEAQFAQRLVKGQVSLAEYFLRERFENLIQRELSLVAGSELKRVLVVGSGVLPISALLLHAQSGVQVDCVARNTDAVEISRQVIDQCGYSGLVQMSEATHSEIDLQVYDLVLIELPFAPKKNILKVVRKRCRPDCQILCRTSYGLRQLLHQGTAERERRGFYIKAEQIAEGSQTLSTWLLEPAGSAATAVQLEWLQTVDSATGHQLLKLMNRTLEEETTIGFPGPIDEETGRALMRQLNADVESGHRHVLVAYKDGAIVGQLILTPNSSPNHRHIVELTRGTIHPSFRGGGLALRAFQEVAQKCEQLGREVICLDVRAGTHAALWWQYFGFKQYGLLQDYSRVGDKRYQGLYLAQTTEELKQRLKELTKASNDPDTPE